MTAPGPTLQPLASSASDADQTPPASTAAPRPRGRTGRILGWVFVIALLIGIALLATRFVAAAPELGGTLNPESPGPSGAKALAEIVRQQGTDIEITRSRTQAEAMIGTDTTLVLTDPLALSDEAALQLVESAERVVILTSSSRMLRLLDLGETVFNADTVDAQCDLPEFSRVGDIDATRLFTPAAGVDGCFRDSAGDAAVLRTSQEGRTLTLLEGGSLLSNEHLAENGNAALGLALLAQTDHVVWYVPSFQDTDRSDDAPDTLGTLTPDWVTPAILLLLLAGLAAIWWRGRRFGALVAESLPVTVRASETMHGRARLTAKAADAPHAAEAIRAGTQTRLATRLALSPRATAQEVADAASDRLGVPRGSLYDLLGGPLPQSDRDLIDLARKLAELETAVENTVHTERNRP